MSNQFTREVHYTENVLAFHYVSAHVIPEGLAAAFPLVGFHFAKTNRGKIRLNTWLWWWAGSSEWEQTAKPGEWILADLDVDPADREPDVWPDKQFRESFMRVDNGVAVADGTSWTDAA